MALPEVTRNIVALLQEGLSSAEIAERLNVSPPTVWGVKSHWRLGRYDDAVSVVKAMPAGGLMDDLSILERLADGVDPLTGEVLPKEHLLQHPEVVRALFHAIRAMDRQGERATSQKSSAPNAGTSWTKQEDAQLIERFENEITIREIARIHGRTEGAINSRLVQLGRLSRQREAKSGDVDT